MFTFDILSNGIVWDTVTVRASDFRSARRTLPFSDSDIIWTD